MRYANGAAPESVYTRALESAVADIRRDEKWRVEYMLLSEKLRESRRLGEHMRSIAQVRKFRNRFGADELAEIYILQPEAVQAILDAIDAHPDWDDETVAENVDFD